MTDKRVKAICPHCSKPVELVVSDREGEDEWMVCTPLSLDEKDVGGQKDTGKGRG